MNRENDEDRTIDNDETIASSGKPPAGATGGPMPEEIGGYRIFGKLGEGGMGVVFEAEQPSPRRRVALKVVRGTEYFDELRFRMFEREAATLARLHHPNIGAIYESGRTDDGRQFFAMELVEGPTLAEWLASRPTEPDREEIELRLRLFRQICDAVHYAHQRGVIHRDLKPSNLIITDTPMSGDGSSVLPSPMVKVLDFGLARIVGDDAAATKMTEVGAIKGTLPYMSPEQVRGDTDDIDVRTDVYALGVVLYEMLCGRRPYAVDARSLLTAVKVINEEAPRPLAEVWTASVKLDPDLATILSTALEKEPDRRFASAAAFGDDIGRLLASQPILARPPSTRYQLQKLVARRKPVFATAGAALALLIVAAIGIGVLYVRSEQNLKRAVVAEQDALREAETATRTSDFLVDLFDRANPERSLGETITAREVVDEGARQIATGLDDEPIMKARLLSTIGQVYMSLAQYEDARRLIEQARELRVKHLPAGDLAIARSDNQLGLVLADLGDRAAALEAYERAAASFAALGPAGRDDLIKAEGNQAWLLGQVGELDAASEAVERALTLARDSRPRLEESMIKLLSNKATILSNRGEADSALVVLEEALDLSLSVKGPDDQQTATVQTNLAFAQARLGHPELATEPYLDALRIYRKIYGDNHVLTARALANIGINFAERGELDAAMPYMKDAQASMIEVFGPDSPMVAQSYMNLGLLKLQTGDAAAAAMDLQRAVDLHEKGAPDGRSISLSYSLYHLATAKATLGDFAAARELLGRVVDIDSHIYGAESAEVADDIETLAELESVAGNPDEAERLQRKAQAIRDGLEP